MLEAFVALSGVLTGEDALDPGLASQYLERVKSGPLGELVAPLLERYAEIAGSGGDVVTLVREQILADGVLGPLARQIIILWYTAELEVLVPKNVTTGTEEQYFRGLLWPAIRAHPPGLSGGYFGHWRYPPDN